MNAKLKRIHKTLSTMERMEHDDIHAHAYVRDVSWLLQSQAELAKAVLLEVDNLSVRQKDLRRIFTRLGIEVEDKKAEVDSHG